jgi:hypothetical protein
MKPLKLTLILILGSGSCAFAQDGRNAVFYQSSAAASGAVTISAFGKAMAPPVQGAPYSATISNEMIQTLADGNRIVHDSTGTIARDSEGRTRQDAALPVIGNLSAPNAPHLVFLQDPVAQISYTLNLTDKTAQKLSASMPPLPPPPLPGGPGPAGAGGTFFIQTGGPVGAGGPSPATIGMQKILTTDEQAQISTEDLGSQTMEGVLVNGVRTTNTIPAGQIGNDRPIVIVTDVWTSPELKTIVYSKRSDPRIGDSTFRLSNIERSEPDSSLFTVPADFKVVDGQQPIVYRPN